MRAGSFDNRISSLIQETFIDFEPYRHQDSRREQADNGHTSCPKRTPPPPYTLEVGRELTATSNYGYGEIK